MALSRAVCLQVSIKRPTVIKCGIKQILQIHCEQRFCNCLSKNDEHFRISADKRLIVRGKNLVFKIMKMDNAWMGT